MDYAYMDIVVRTFESTKLLKMYGSNVRWKLDPLGQYGRFYRPDQNVFWRYVTDITGGLNVPVIVPNIGQANHERYAKPMLILIDIVFVSILCLDK